MMIITEFDSYHVQSNVKCECECENDTASVIMKP